MGFMIELDETDIGTLQSAVENLRSADRTTERIEAAWRIAFKLEQIAKDAYKPADFMRRVNITQGFSNGHTTQENLRPQFVAGSDRIGRDMGYRHRPVGALTMALRPALWFWLEEDQIAVLWARCMQYGIDRRFFR